MIILIVPLMTRAMMMTRKMILTIDPPVTADRGDDNDVVVFVDRN